MAKEILTIPEEDLKEVIEIIRTGLIVSDASVRVRSALWKWVEEEEKYLESIGAP